VRDELQLPLRSVTPDYFDALGLRLVAGRGFRMSDDRPAPRVAVINEAMAKRFFGDQPALGRKFNFGGNNPPPIEVVGVLADTRTGSLLTPPAPEIYLSFWQNGAFSKHMIVRTEGDPKAVSLAVQRELKAVDPIAAVDHIKTLEDIRGDSVAAQTFAMRLLVGFSVVGTVLALVGIYGVLSLSVNSRQREIAIRMALGAQRNTVLSLVLGEGFRLMTIGLLVGTGVAIALAQVLKAYLFGVEPTDLVTFLVVALLFFVVALFACYFPARRATAVDPMVALRNE
jgi:putative ABC transport system permease protein